MDLDISHLLEHWDYKPGQVVVRKFKARDGTEKIQLRVDLGLLQMNAEGRPDGKQPFGHPSLHEYYQSKLYKHIAENDGSEEGFKLKAEDCSKLQLESLQYHHRYICLLQLGDFAGVMRDAERNLTVFEFVGKHAESDELAWSLRQFQPQLLMIHTRAQAMQALEAGDYPDAIQLVEDGIETIRNFFREYARNDLLEQSGEIQSLEAWLAEIRANRPLSAREKLEQALSEAVKREDYEKAAEVRDALRNLEQIEKE
jgi:tetratricopeptide (TPR) repeat protein